MENSTLPRPVVECLASRSHRLAHLLWHATREHWSALPEERRREFAREFPAWVPPRPSLDAAGRPVYGTCAGEDFLYMHRQMIAHVNAMLARHGAPPVEGWRQLPGRGDPAFPVPRHPNLPVTIYKEKDDDCWEGVIRPGAAKFSDPDYLRSVPLSLLGTEIEHTIHVHLHRRYGGIPACGSRPARNGFVTRPDPRWDGPEYDSLLDNYAAHVHPWFWKIHGWIDARVDDWVRAHGYREAPWKGTWTGPLPDCGGGDHPHPVRGSAGAGPAPAAVRGEAGLGAAPDPAAGEGLGRALAYFRDYSGRV